MTPKIYVLSLAGVMNAADYYSLDELKSACTGFIQVSKILLVDGMIKRET